MQKQEDFLLNVVLEGTQLAFFLHPFQILVSVKEWRRIRNVIIRKLSNFRSKDLSVYKKHYAALVLKTLPSRYMRVTIFSNFAEKLPLFNVQVRNV